MCITLHLRLGSTQSMHCSSCRSVGLRKEGGWYGTSPRAKSTSDFMMSCSLLGCAESQKGYIPTTSVCRITPALQMSAACLPLPPWCQYSPKTQWTYHRHTSELLVCTSCVIFMIKNILKFMNITPPSWKVLAG